MEGFYKPHNCIIADGEDIVLPEGAGRVDEEGELVAIIGKTCSKVSKEDALDYVMGYTIGNDVSARDWQNGPEKDMQWWRAKGADTFGPLGPVISTDFNPFDFTIQVSVNGEKTPQPRPRRGPHLRHPHRRQRDQPLRYPGPRRHHLHGYAGAGPASSIPATWWKWRSPELGRSAILW